MVPSAAAAVLVTTVLNSASSGAGQGRRRCRRSRRRSRVAVWPASETSTSVKLSVPAVVRLPALSEGSCAAVSAASARVSDCAAEVITGASLVPVMVMVTVWLSEVAVSSVDRDRVGQVDALAVVEVVEQRLGGVEGQSMVAVGRGRRCR